MRVFAASDVGRVRTENQDSYFAGPIPEGREKSHGQLLIVADGMGGHASGEVASKLAVETILKVYYGEPLGLGADPSLLLRRAFQAANLAILEAGRREQRHFGMGTTCTALLLRGGLAWTCHVGDTRIYRYRDGELEQLTKDHTLLQQMIEGGQLQPDELLRRSIKHIPVRAMGSEERVRLTPARSPSRSTRATPSCSPPTACTICSGWRRSPPCSPGRTASARSSLSPRRPARPAPRTT
jgi:protein phosphatase